MNSFTKSHIVKMLKLTGFNIKDLTIEDNTIYGLSLWATKNGLVLSIQCRWCVETNELKSYGIGDEIGNYEEVEIALWKEAEGIDGDFLTPSELGFSPYENILPYQNFDQLLNAIDYCSNKI